MKTDTVITLKNQKKYLLLLESELDLDGYFLGVELDSKNEPTNTYIVLQDIEKDNKHFVKKIDDPSILNQLLQDYQLQYEENYEEDDQAE